MKIVVIDGDQAARESMVQAIEEIGDMNNKVVGVASNVEDGYWLIKQTNPDLAIMDGRLSGGEDLELLHRIRQDKSNSYVAIYADIQDIQLIQKAVNLGIVGFLLKPHIDSKMLRDILDSTSRLTRSNDMLSMENLMLKFIHGEVQNFEEIEEYALTNYNQSFRQPGTVICIWMGDEYEKKKGIVKTLLREITISYNHLYHLIEFMDSWKCIFLFLLQDGKNDPRERIRSEYLLNIRKRLGNEVVIFDGYIKHFHEISELLPGITSRLEWALLFPYVPSFGWMEVGEISGRCKELQYPVELEAAAMKGMRSGDKNCVEKGYRELYYYVLREGPFHPKQIKQAFIRLTWQIMSVLDSLKMEDAIEIEGHLFRISIANTWREIQINLQSVFEIFGKFFNTSIPLKETSSLVSRAEFLIDTEYMSQLTLGRVAHRLFVSREYLSKVFKRDRGVGFNQALRDRRLENVKAMLLSTDLQMKTIAQASGFEDAKYMTRVFKEVEGMTPTEYRKTH